MVPVKLLNLGIVNFRKLLLALGCVRCQHDTVDNDYCDVWEDEGKTCECTRCNRNYGPKRTVISIFVSTRGVDIVMASLWKIYERPLFGQSA